MQKQSDQPESLAKAKSATPAKERKAIYVGAIDDIVRQSITHLFLEGDDSESREWRKALVDESDALKDELAGPKPSAIEYLLAERTATCSAIASMFDYQYVLALRKNKASSAEFWGKQAEKANNRLLRAVATLAMVRKVQGPVVQVNIGEKQINVAGNGSLPQSTRLNKREPVTGIEPASDTF